MSVTSNGPRTKTLEIDVPGKARPKGSMRSLGAGKPMIESNPDVKPWMASVRAIAVGELDGHDMLAGPLSLNAIFYFARPASHYGTGKNEDKLKPSAPSKPCNRATGDTDKLVRATLDALEGVAFLDDAQVSDVHAVRRYSRKGRGDHTMILITSEDEE